MKSGNSRGGNDHDEKFILTLERNRLCHGGRMGDERVLIDWEQLDMMADGYTPDFVEIYREFLEQTPELLGALERHILAGEVEAARDAAHKIKGSSANFGFVAVSEPMSRLELQAKEARDLEGAEDRMLEARGNFENARAEVRAKRGI